MGYKDKRGYIGKWKNYKVYNVTYEEFKKLRLSNREEKDTELVLSRAYSLVVDNFFKELKDPI